MSPPAGSETFPRREPPRLRRLIAASLILTAAAIAVAVAVAPWTFSSKALYEEVASQINRSSGLFVATGGRSTISLLPRPHITIEQVLFADPANVVTIQTESVRGNLNLWRLLTGRLELSDISLKNPRMTVDLDRKPINSGGATSRAAAAQPSSPEALKADQEQLGGVSIKGGQLQVRYDGKDETFANIDAALDWPRVGAPATFTGSFSWKGERLQALLWVARPGDLLRGEATPATARLDAESLRVEAEGMAQLGAKPHFTGRFSGSAPSLRQALNLLGLETPLPSPIEHVQLAGQASIGPRELQLTNLNLFASDNEFHGSFIVREEDGRPIVQGALSSNFLSLRPMMADLPLMTSSDGQWSREPFELPSLDGVDVDVRISAAHARLARFTINDAALSLTLRAGRLEIALSEGKAYKGAIKARAIFAVRRGSLLESHVSAQTNGVDAGMLFWDAVARSDISGNLDASLSLDAVGESIAQIMRNLDGRATIALTQGTLDGVNLERALRRLDKRPLSSAIDIRSGRTVFDRAGAVVEIEQGTATIHNGSASGPGFSLAFSGSTRVADRSLAVKAVAAEADSAGKPRENGLQIGFDISGSWDEPTFAPDAQAFIRRSGAAAPLLPQVEQPTPASPRGK